MTVLGRRIFPLGLALAVLSAAPARAQFVVAETETLDFDRPESWGIYNWRAVHPLRVRRQIWGGSVGGGLRLA